jgi:hypothetical protein
MLTVTPAANEIVTGHSDDRTSPVGTMKANESDRNGTVNHLRRCDQARPGWRVATTECDKAARNRPMGRGVRKSIVYCDSALTSALTLSKIEAWAGGLVKAVGIHVICDSTSD